MCDVTEIAIADARAQMLQHEWIDWVHTGAVSFAWSAGFALIGLLVTAQQLLDKHVAALTARPIEKLSLPQRLLLRWYALPRAVHIAAMWLSLAAAPPALDRWIETALIQPAEQRQFGLRAVDS